MRTAAEYHYLLGGLLLHLFTLTSPKAAVIFCHANQPYSSFPLGSMAPYVVRTFLSRPKWDASDKFAYPLLLTEIVSILQI